MFKVIAKNNIAPDRYSMIIEAPEVSRTCLPGQFVILIVEENGERIPLTICDNDPQLGEITLVFEAIGVSTKKLAHKEVGEYILHLVGPLGLPSKFVNEDIEILRNQHLLLVGGGLGAAILIPQGKWLKENHIPFDVLLGSRSKEFIVLEEEFRKLADNLFIVTDDGSYGFHGLTPEGLKVLVEERKKFYDLCVIIGPMAMMKYTSLMTKKLNIPSVVSMNTIMVDGTGMCGACRVVIDGKTKFACVDGPEFDAHLVDFDGTLLRQGQYKKLEVEAHHEYCDLMEGMSDESI